MDDITRRGVIAGGAGLAVVVPGASRTQSAQAERWGLVELAMAGSPAGNPFDVSFGAEFTHGDQTIRMPGFYDGEGVFRVRFSPPSEGVWSWRTSSSDPALGERSGETRVGPAQAHNHGPVGVTSQFHFAHADGTPFRQVGTTSYGWTHQPEPVRRLTLATLARAPFNKIRMLVFPNTSLTTNEPLSPYEKTGPGDRDHDLTRFNPAYFQRLDACVAALMGLGIQADVILFHPYDGKFGFDEMSPEMDERYLRYVVARLSAYRNVWWSMANEFDILKKPDAEWDRLFQVVQDADPHDRLRSIHNWRRYYDNGKPWVTHSSIQNGSAVLDDARAETYRSVWGKPVVFDEVEYEGNLSERWGDLTGPQMVAAFWHGLIGGTYVGHSECFPRQPGDGFWLGEGGELRGQSWPRLAFLKSIMEAGPVPGVDPIDKWWEQHLGGVAGQYYLRFFGQEAPSEWAVTLPRDALSGGEPFRIELIDTWNMTIEPVSGVFTMRLRPDTKYFYSDPDRPTISLPGRAMMALRITRAG